MSPAPRRALTIDDPVGGREACQVAHLRRRWTTGSVACMRSQFRTSGRTPTSRASTSTRSRSPRWPTRSVSVACSSRSSFRPLPASGFELVAGERRWRAAQLAGNQTIPTLIDDTFDGAGSLELALIENVAREDSHQSKRPGRSQAAASSSRRRGLWPTGGLVGRRDRPPAAQREPAAGLTDQTL